VTITSHWFRASCPGKTPPERALPARTTRRTRVGGIILLIVVGAIAGFIARALVPGKDSMGIVPTIVLGIVGSFIGGFLGALIFGRDALEGLLQPSGIIGSIIGAVIALLVYRAVSGRSNNRVGVR
jgi:uncharacterized membrane protein YeaQ/YmgE (transglycosylase-associated protein family)